MSENKTYKKSLKRKQRPLTAIFYEGRKEDDEIWEQWQMLKDIGHYQAKQVVRAGIIVLMGSETFKNKLQIVKKRVTELGEELEGG